MKLRIDFEAGLKVLATIARHGLEAPVTGAQVEEATGISARVVTDIVTLAAQYNVPIGSCPRGYFKWRSAAEREAYIHQESNRLRSLGRKLAGIKKAAQHDELSLFEQEAA